MANNEQKLDEPALWLPSNLDAAGDPLPGEPQYTPRVDRRLIESAMTEGVYDKSGGHMLVRERAAGANMSVEIDPGFAAVSADGQAYAGRYLAICNAVQTVQIDAAPAAGSRIDTIVVRVHDSSISGTRNEAVFEALKGTTVTSGSPPYPTQVGSAITLARITVTDTVAGQPRVSITNADIADFRQQARSPLGVTEYRPGSAAFPPVTDAPSVWPDGVTTSDVSIAAGWPADGTLTTTKNTVTGDTKQRVTQLITAQNGGAKLLYRASELVSGSWVWSPWRGVPLPPVFGRQAAGTETRTLSTYNTMANMPQLQSVQCGPSGLIEVGLKCRCRAVSGGAALVSFEVLIEATTTVVQGPSDSEAIGMAQIGGDYVITSGIFYVENLDPAKKYRIRPVFRANGTDQASFTWTQISARGY